MILHRQRRISRRGLQNALSATRFLERLGALLALGRRRTLRAAISMAINKNGASQAVAMIGPKRGSTHNTRIGPKRKPTPKTTPK
jgi:hypothetical protein